MKGIILAITMCFMFSPSFGENEYDIITENGNTYIQINDDLQEFKFSSDFKSIGNSGFVGYTVNGSLSTQTYSKKDGFVSATSLKSGDKLGFYLNRKNGDTVTDWNIKSIGNMTYISFDKNYGRGNDEMMSFGDIVVVRHNYDQPTTGMPTIGFIPTMFIGIFFFMFMYCRNTRLSK